MADKYGGIYPKAWSARSIAVYERIGREPAKTKTGLWVEDVERESKELVLWSLAELYAFASGELSTSYVLGSSDYYNAVRGKALKEHPDAIQWGESDLDEWLLNETTPKKTLNGNYVNDPSRWVKDAAHWNDSELIDLGLGEFGPIEPNQFYILDEAADRFDLPIGITYDDYCAYITKNTLPEMTPNGLLVNTWKRKANDAEFWSEDELTAWLNNWIECADPRVLEFAIKKFGGEASWTKGELIDWVENGVLPEVVQEIIEVSEPEEVIEPEPETIEEEVVPVEEVHEPEPEMVQEEEPEQVDEVFECNWEMPEIVKEGPFLDAMNGDIDQSVIDNTSRRRLLPASGWSIIEIAGWIRGVIPIGMNVTETSLCNIVRSHCTPFVNNWVDVELIEYLRNGELPRGIKSGVLYNDKLRDKVHPTDWPEADLRAWCRGDVSTKHDPSIIMISIRRNFSISDKFKDNDAVKAYVGYGVPLVEGPKIITNVNGSTPSEVIDIIKGKVLTEGCSSDELIRIARYKLKIDPHWTDDHVYSFYRNGQIPRTTSLGTLVEDRLRDDDSPLEWKIDDFRALALGEIEANFSIVSKESLDVISKALLVQFNVSTRNWSPDEIVEFLTSKRKPVALANGVFVNDPARENKLAASWSRNELTAWLRREIKSTAKAPEDDLWLETYIKFDIPANWYREDARSYALNGVRVPATPSGIYIRDQGRDFRKIEHWTRREIKAWARGLILPGINCDENEMAIHAARIFNISSRLDNESIKKRISDILTESMTMSVKFVSEDLKSYLEGRKQAGDNSTAAAPYQRLLDRCINRVLRLKGEEFVQGWTELLNFFYEHSNGVCSARKIYVGVGEMAITPRALKHFQNMTSVLSSTANPKTRERATHLIDWKVALGGVTVEDSRQAILAYYGV